LMPLASTRQQAADSSLCLLSCSLKLLRSAVLPHGATRGCHAWSSLERQVRWLPLAPAAVSLSSSLVRWSAVALGMRSGRCYSGSSSAPHATKIPIPRDKIEVSFSRSSGPGGQNVNKVNTKVELRFKVSQAAWIPGDVKERLRTQRAGDINKNGELVITSSVHRTQGHNTEEAFRKLARYIEDACVVPKERIATQVPDSAIEQRLKEKKSRSAVKQNRQKPRWGE